MISMGFDDVNPSSSDNTESNAKGEAGLFDKIFSLILGAGDPERDKRRQLKAIAKDLKKSKLRFYNCRGQQALPGLGKFFFDIYKNVGPAQTLIQNADASGALKTIIIESHLSAEQLELVEVFSESSLREKARTVETKQLAADIKDAMVSYFANFDSAAVKSINSTYNLLLLFQGFIHFDYYFLLKKFDSSLREKDYGGEPKFESINGEYISDDLKDFLECALPMDKNADWEHLFDILKAYRSIDPVSRQAWKKQLAWLENIKKQGVLEQIVRHIDGNPYFKPTVKTRSEHIIEDYLAKMKTQTELTVQKILMERKNQQMDKLVSLVFGSPIVARMKNYTEKANLTFSKKIMVSYTQTAAANYLKAFLLDYVKKDLRDIRDLVVVRGKWSTNILSQQISEHFHQLMTISDELIKFDDACAEEGDYGQRIRKHANRAEKDQASAKFLKDTVREMNDRAGHLINEAGQSLVLFGKSLKSLVEDYDKSPASEILINWKEVDAAREGKIKSIMSEAYKKIYYFIQLIQLVAGKTKQ